MKIISNTAHGILDYLTVTLFAMAPSLFGFSGTAALVSYALCVVHLTMTLLTDMPLGLIKIIPMRLHSMVEFLVGPILVVAALALPGIFAGARWLFVAAGAMIFVVWLLSDYRSTAKFEDRSRKAAR